MTYTLSIRQYSSDLHKQNSKHWWISSICPYVFSYKRFAKSDFFVDSYLEHSSDEKKGDCISFPSLKSIKID